MESNLLSSSLQIMLAKSTGESTGENDIYVLIIAWAARGYVDDIILPEICLFALISARASSIISK